MIVIILTENCKKVVRKLPFQFARIISAIIYAIDGF